MFRIVKYPCCIVKQFIICNYIKNSFESIDIIYRWNKIASERGSVNFIAGTDKNDSGKAE